MGSLTLHLQQPEDPGLRLALCPPGRCAPASPAAVAPGFVDIGLATSTSRVGRAGSISPCGVPGFSPIYASSASNSVRGPATPAPLGPFVIWRSRLPSLLA